MRKYARMVLMVAFTILIAATVFFKGDHPTQRTEPEAFPPPMRRSNIIKDDSGKARANEKTPMPDGDRRPSPNQDPDRLW